MTDRTRPGTTNPLAKGHGATKRGATEPVRLRPSGPRAGGGTRTAGRLAALGRAELTLLVRNRTALFMALLMPVAMLWLIRLTVSGSRAAGTGTSATETAMPGGIGVVLVLVVYANLVPAYVARREELVLKRLRTGEAKDLEILAGTALPSVSVALAQCALLVGAGTLILDVTAPKQPELLLAGVLLGSLLLVALAAVSSAVTRTVESAQLTVLPLMAVSFFGSGLFVPPDVMPERLSDVMRLMPLTPVVDLVRYGWLGGAGADEVLYALVRAVAWTALSVFAVRRWFRWEPRR
ncbi:ABC transporter permease [Streptomyces sp. NPDC047108]|uniref:ABC transporter permease n=1 Tax=Streptomyces sp. NPDC047108 TaxID=3155025 RepID=UPI0033D71676